MCGLVGVFGDGWSKNKELFEELLHVDYIRGPHSTGVAFLNEKYVQVIKDTVTPEELTYYKKYQKAMNKEHLGLMGHNRQATRGSITHDNAHPFMHGSITLTHNGTCSSVHPLPKQFSTDSEAICYAINEWGIEKTWDKMEYNNPGTLVFWNAKEKTLNIISNGSRPIFFSYLKEKSAMIYGSEDWMYRGVCSRNNVELWKDADGVSVFFLEKDKLLSFSYDKKEKKVSYKIKKIEFTKNNYQHNAYMDNHSAIDWKAERDKRAAPFLNSTPIRTTETGKTTTPLVGPVAKLNVEKFKASLGGAAKGIGMHDFYNKYNYCIGCDESLLDEYAGCFILDDKSAFCSECITGFISLGVNPDKQLNVTH